MDDLNLWGVNWIDGMLVTSKHLNQQEDFSINLNRWTASGLAFGYGLVKSPTYRSEPLEIDLRRDGNVLHISLLSCQALMPNGSVVSINSQFTSLRTLELRFDLSKESRERLPLYLYVSSSDRITFGDPQAGEQLPRAPYQIPKVALSIGSSENYSASAGIQIAELVRSGGDFKLNEAYVPPVLTSTAGIAVSKRMERIKQLVERIQKSGLAAIAEVKLKTKSKPSAAQEETIRGIFLQSETLLHYIAYNYNQLFDKAVGIGIRNLMNFSTSLVRGFSQSFLVYPELREYVRNAEIPLESGNTVGGSLLPELQDYQSVDYGFDELTRFFDDTEKILGYLQGILSYYASGAAGRTGDSVELGGFRYIRQHHGAVKYSFRSSRHYLIVDGVDPRGTEDVVVRLDKKILPHQYAANVIIYLGANEVDDIAAASVCRKPVDDVTDPSFWLIQPNEYFPLKCDRLDRLNIILDGELDRGALEAVRMDHLSIFSRAR